MPEIVCFSSPLAPIPKDERHEAASHLTRAAHGTSRIILPASARFFSLTLRTRAATARLPTSYRMLQRLRTRTVKPAARRVDASTTTTPEQDKVRDRLLAMILRNESARRQARK